MNTIEFSTPLLTWLEGQRPSGHGLEISLTKAGCAGFEHHMRWMDSPVGTSMESNAPFWVVVPAGQEQRLTGLKMGMVRKGLNQDIQWENPNATEACGCGISWTFPERSLPILG